jgi:penicillin-insensitive murein DD-endopeptidase
MLKKIRVIFLCTILFACKAQVIDEKDSIQTSQPKTKTELELYIEQHPKPNLSISKGTVSKGSLDSACLLPFTGENYKYFSKRSYLYGRAFVHLKVAEILTASFDTLATLCPNRTFYIMEGSNEHGGKMHPHRTHQNGTSIDLMIPLRKQGEIYTKLDTIDVDHYLLKFNTKGQWEEDTLVEIDFETLALEILTIQEQAKLRGSSIQKIILNTNLQDELFNTIHGPKLRASGIYFTRNLEKIINELHDDHIHIDFNI